METVEQFFSMDGPLAKAFKGYEIREQQVEFSQAIEMAIEEKVPMVGEAPTGVGKSLAALVPAFQAMKKGKKVLVVTSSILLQEQYFYKDVPLLEKLFNFNASPVLIKGKGNYVCLHKAINAQPNYTTPREQEEYDMLLEWSRHTQTGDKSDLSFEPLGKVWGNFAIMEENECAGKMCPLFNQCHYYRERFKMESAKLIICNYHYLFTAFSNSALLPQGIDIVIMDEGHEAVGIARDMTQESYSTNSFTLMNDRLQKAEDKLNAESGYDLKIKERVGLTYLTQTLNTLMTQVATFYYKHRPQYQDSWKLEEAELNALREMSITHLDAFDDALDNLATFIAEDGLDQDMRGGWDDIYTKEQIDFQLAVEQYSEWLASKRYLVAYIFGHTDKYPLDPEGVERIIWIEKFQENSVRIKTQSTNASPVTSLLFKSDPEFVLAGATPIIISATMTVNQNFKHVKEDLGLITEHIEATVDTPFDLHENMLWYLPKDIVEASGTNTGKHAVQVMEEMERIINVFDGRTMCLFTSVKAMEIAARQFKALLPKHIDVLVQGELPKKVIIEKMKQNPHSVIVGTRSFFTGVDIQGSNLSAVLIDKIPFPMVSEPVNQHLMDKPRGFYDFAIPEMVIVLKQGFGRLNRTASDKGVVAVFDGRLASGSYKNRVFNSFGHKIRATRNFEDVENLAKEIIANDNSID